MLYLFHVRIIEKRLQINFNPKIDSKFSLSYSGAGRCDRATMKVRYRIPVRQNNVQKNEKMAFSLNKFVNINMYVWPCWWLFVYIGVLWSVLFDKIAIFVCHLVPGGRRKAAVAAKIWGSKKRRCIETEQYPFFKCKQDLPNHQLMSEISLRRGE